MMLRDFDDVDKTVRECHLTRQPSHKYRIWDPFRAVEKKSEFGNYVRKFRYNVAMISKKFCQLFEKCRNNLGLYMDTSMRG